MSEIQQERNIPLATLAEIYDGYQGFYECSNKLEGWEFHCHDYYEFYIHLNSGQYFGVDNELYLLEPDQFFILPPFSMHGLSNISELVDYERAYVNITPEVLRILGCDQIDLDRYFRSYTAKGMNRFQLSKEESKRLIEIVKQLQKNQHATRNLDKFQNYSLLLEFLATLCHVIDHTEALTSTVMSNSIIQQVLNHINSNYTQPMKIAELAKQFNVSVSYLSHEFAKYTNRSIYDYILYRRVMLAKKMMTTDASLNSIAYQCGFNDYSNFLRMFNKLVGLSPRQYRNQLKAMGVHNKEEG